MITTPTVFVLGAGASIPFGFPSGENLVTEICAQHYSTHHLDSLGFGRDETDDFIRELELSDPPSVDAFLEHRQGFMKIGKVAIACQLLKYEEKASEKRRGQGNKARWDWYSYLLDKMTTTFADFDRNQVSFVTFNYDRSFEHYLFTTLLSRYGKSEDEVKNVLNKLSITHVHGQLGFLEWQQDAKPDTAVQYGLISRDMIRIAANGIKIISEKMDEKVQFQKAWDLMNAAKLIFFLGFGYHPVNMERLQIPLNKVNKPASQGFTNLNPSDVIVRGTGWELTPVEKVKIMQDHSGLILSEYTALDFLKNEQNFQLRLS